MLAFIDGNVSRARKVHDDDDVCGRACFSASAALTYPKERTISNGDDTRTTRGEIMDRAEWHPYSPSGLASGGAPPPVNPS